MRRRRSGLSSTYCAAQVIVCQYEMRPGTLSVLVKTRLRRGASDQAVEAEGKKSQGDFPLVRRIGEPFACKRRSLRRLAACGSKPLLRPASRGFDSRRPQTPTKKNRPQDGFFWMLWWRRRESNPRRMKDLCGFRDVSCLYAVILFRKSSRQLGGTLSFRLARMFSLLFHPTLRDLGVRCQFGG